MYELIRILFLWMKMSNIHENLDFINWMDQYYYTISKDNLLINEWFLVGIKLNGSIA